MKPIAPSEWMVVHCSWGCALVRILFAHECAPLGAYAVVQITCLQHKGWVCCPHLSRHNNANKVDSETDPFILEVEMEYFAQDVHGNARMM